MMKMRKKAPFLFSFAYISSAAAGPELVQIIPFLIPLGIEYPQYSAFHDFAVQ